MAQQTKLRVAGERAKVLVRTIGFDRELCTRTQHKDATCARCQDICPSKALTIKASTANPGGEDVTIAKLTCVDCGLCCAVCPTGALTLMESTVRAIRRRLTKADRTVDEGDHDRRGHVYLTCVETGLVKSDPSVVEVPCLGVLTWETWANLMLEFPNLAVYLPGDLCGRCKAKAAEMMIVDEVVHAQEVTSKEMPLVESMRELDFTTSNGAIRPDRRERYADKGDSFSAILRDVTAKHINEDDMPTEDMGPYDAKKMRLRLRKEIEAAPGEDTPGLAGAVAAEGESSGFGGTVSQARWALLDSLMRHPQIAGQASFISMQLDAQALPSETLAACEQACPTGAIRREDEGAAPQVTPSLCEMCGLCADICAKAQADAGEPVQEGSLPKGVTTITVNCVDLLARTEAQD